MLNLRETHTTIHNWQKLHNQAPQLCLAHIGLVEQRLQRWTPDINPSDRECHPEEKYNDNNPLERRLRRNNVLTWNNLSRGLSFVFDKSLCRWILPNGLFYCLIVSCFCVLCFDYAEYMFTSWVRVILRNISSVSYLPKYWAFFIFVLMSIFF